MIILIIRSLWVGASQSINKIWSLLVRQPKMWEVKSMSIKYRQSKLLVISKGELIQIKFLIKMVKTLLNNCKLKTGFKWNWLKKVAPF